MSTPASATPETSARARQILEQRGIRPTSQRLKVAEILLTTPRHLTAEQILATLRASSGHVSKATVYNTLNLFVGQGLAREIHADPERCVYDSTMAPHHHFQNVDTGEMIDIRPEDLAFAQLPPLPEGTEIESVDVVIRVRRKD
ncbi:MAG: transcriptional repressor [Steroidobacteraceae bacterium]|nr:transcriptional repressor [Steroidobacteraceae bacterium]